MDHERQLQPEASPTPWPPPPILPLTMEVEEPQGSLARLDGLLMNQPWWLWAGQQQYEESEWERRGIGVVEHGREEGNERRRTGTRG